MPLRLKNKLTTRPLIWLWKEACCKAKIDAKTVLLKATIMDEDLRVEICKTQQAEKGAQTVFIELLAHFSNFCA